MTPQPFQIFHTVVAARSIGCRYAPDPWTCYRTVAAQYGEGEATASLAQAADGPMLDPGHADAAKACGKIRQLSVAFLFAETIRRISDGESVTSLFSEQNNNF